MTSRDSSDSDGDGSSSSGNSDGSSGGVGGVGVGGSSTTTHGSDGDGDTASDSSTVTHPPLLLAAGLVSLVHLLTGMASYVFALPGLPPQPLVDRLVYVGAESWWWRLTWLLWIATGMSLVWLLGLARGRLLGEPLAKLAWQLGLVALCVDAVCDLVQAFVMPGRALAALGPPLATHHYLEPERWLALGGLTVANGLYSLAVLAATLAVARRGARSLLLTGLPLAASGLWLAVLGVLGNTTQVVLFTVITLAWCLVWPLHLAWLLERGGGSPETAL
jgi:hypothetical protein